MKLVFATNNAGGNLKVAYVKGAKFYRIQFERLAYTRLATLNSSAQERPTTAMPI